MTTQIHDVVIIGGGHNALTAAAYLARAGRRVLLLEAADHLGGAAVSAQAFDGVDARLSRYSYLVSLLPRQIVDDLGLDVELVRRRYSCYTPDPADPTRGLLVDNEADDAERVRAFERVDAGSDVEPWNAWYDATARLAEVLFPTLTQPLPTRSQVADAARAAGAGEAWHDVVERPIGEAVERRFTSDLVRGVVATDALIGTFAGLHDDDLAANRCYLYHVIGGGTGDWDVPVGGMGAVSGALSRAARQAGAQLVTGARVLSVTPDGDVRYLRGGDVHEVRGSVVLSGVAPAVLDQLLDAAVGLPPGPRPTVEGAQVKVNLLVTRLPRLRDTEVDPAAAFAGTFHVNELATQLEEAFRQASDGEVPSPLPAEIYCHTLSDRTILGDELAAGETQTLTVFGIHVPDRLVETIGNDELRARLETAVLASLDSVLAEPLADVLALDEHGRPCLEVRTTRDIENSVGMPGGNIFHGPLSWPWREDDRAPAGEGDGGARERTRLTPAQRWGVATRHSRILMCGSGAVRGGAVSGIGGHNAAMAVLEAE
ncbi:hypothetical protein C8046_13060 [Serinibacter arcticus]|uniref:Beta-carotene ketolase n=1 Tax=Serinibacter arcticus TaxID=1655435 RepID=A0A2U1ZWS6_9MICO|nr:NAD(P)/FAD-dependent oxidoreductase [Serinibacter arcticus]PWD51447.1 hypothetical protein C8046_13060 [Serinibacter arcticus]